jgi:N-acetyl sugar amidotransferase
MTEKRICNFCVMDTSVPVISFDIQGQCDCCRTALNRLPHEWWPNELGKEKIDTLVQMLKETGRDKDYDVMVGLSGGIDSAYLAHLMVTKYNLRLLAVHVDGGWNSEPAVRNIESIVRKLDIDLYTHVIDWSEMRDVQWSFLKSGVLNQDMPQDHAFFATLYATAKRYKMTHFLSGVNFASECVVPPKWGHPSMDGKHVQAIHKAFGTQPLVNYPIMGLPEFLWMTRVRRQLQIHRPLNYFAYDKESAKLELTKLYDWRDYGGKHHESRFTKFYQEIYLPQKFSFDKRRLHLSSLIVSGQMNREKALAELAAPLTEAHQERRDVNFISKKLGFSAAELLELINAKPVPHENYPNGMRLHRNLSRLKSLLRGERRL